MRMVRRGMGDFSFDNFGLPDFTDPTWSDPALAGGSYSDYSTGFDPSQLQTNMPTVSYDSGGTSGGSGFDWMHGIPLIGNTLASLISTINHPTAPAAFQSPPAQSTAPVVGGTDYQSVQATGSTGAPASSGSVIDWMRNPANLPWVIGGAALAAFMIGGGAGSAGRR